MKTFNYFFSSLLFLVCNAALAGKTYTATGYAKRYSCSEGVYADCTRSRSLAINAAMADCYDSGHRTCILRYAYETSSGGSCNNVYDANDYCNSAAIVYGK